MNHEQQKERARKEAVHHAEHSNVMEGKREYPIDEDLIRRNGELVPKNPLHNKDIRTSIKRDEYGHMQYE